MCISLQNIINGVCFHIVYSTFYHSPGPLGGDFDFIHLASCSEREVSCLSVLTLFLIDQVHPGRQRQIDCFRSLHLAVALFDDPSACMSETQLDVIVSRYIG